MKIKLIDHGYKVLGLAPQRAHYNDSGADVFATNDTVLRAGAVTKVPVGVGCEIPDGYDIVVHCKSGLSSKGIFAMNAPVDAGYTGEINAILFNATSEDILIEQGEKVGQLVVRPVVYAEFVESLGEERGENAFGSSGNMAK